jgi:hypothetical protein
MIRDAEKPPEIRGTKDFFRPFPSREKSRKRRESGFFSVVPAFRQNFRRRGKPFFPRAQRPFPPRSPGGKLRFSNRKFFEIVIDKSKIKFKFFTYNKLNIRTVSQMEESPKLTLSLRFESV